MKQPRCNRCGHVKARHLPTGMCDGTVKVHRGWEPTVVTRCLCLGFQPEPTS